MKQQLLFVLQVLLLTVGEVSLVSCSTVSWTQQQVNGTLSCPPGYVPGPKESSACECGRWPNGVVVCDEATVKAYILVGYCMTYDDVKNETVTGKCPYSYYRNDSLKFYIPLPEYLSTLNEFMCGNSLNRTGELCGTCKSNFTVPLFMYASNFKCVECNGNSYNWLIYTGVEFIPVTVFFIAVVLFSINITSPSMNSLIFFSQISTAGISSSFLDIQNFVTQQGSSPLPHSEVVPHILHHAYSIWNLDFFRFHFLYSPLCFDGMSTVHVRAMAYITALYPLFLVVLLYICIKLYNCNFRPLVRCWKPFHKCWVHYRRRVDPKAKVIDAFATFLLLTHVKLMLVSYDLLTTTQLYKGDGKELNSTSLYYDATVQIFQGQHLPFGIIAVLILATFTALPPLVLLMYPTKIFQKFLVCINFSPPQLHAFADVFTGCYKDGISCGNYDMRFIAGAYYVLRIVILSASLFEPTTYLVTSIFVYILTAMFFALMKPYKNNFYNVFDALMFALLSMIYTAILYHILYITVTSNNSIVLVVLTEVLAALPLLYELGLVIWWFIRKSAKCLQKYGLLQLQIERRDVPLPDRLISSEDEEYKPLL